jgi:hypothetical protein
MNSNGTKFSVLNLVDLPAFERQVWLVLSRRGSTDPVTLAQQMDCNPKDVEDALANLKRKGQPRKGKQRKGNSIRYCANSQLHFSSMPTVAPTGDKNSRLLN